MKNHIGLNAGLLGGLVLSSAPLLASDFNLGPIDVTIDSAATVGVAWRIENRDPDLVAIANGGNAQSTNGDDGNLAFETGEVVASAFKLTSDVTFQWGNFGAFVRGNYLYDPKLHGHAFFDPNDYGAGREAPQSERRFKEGKVQDKIGSDGDLLDAYIFGNFRIGNRDLAVRVGRQHLGWGEANLIRNGLDSVTAVDANHLRVPGFEIVEVFTPLSMVWASMSLPFGMDIEAFYQLDWQQTEPFVAGSYFSSSDFVGQGATRANLGFGRAPENTPGTSLARLGDNEPDDGGQYGVALHAYVEALDTSLSLYGANFHSRLPVFSGISAQVPQLSFGANYFIEYPEDVQLFGVSFNSPGPFGLAVQGEYSYKIDQPLQIDDVELLLTGLGIPSQLNRNLGGASGQQYIRGWRRHDISQIDLSVTQALEPNELLGYDQLLFLVEGGLTYVHDLPENSELRYDGPGTWTPGFTPETDGQFRGVFLASQGLEAQQGGYATSMSWGYRVLLRATYHNAIGPLKLLPGLLFAHDVNGVTPAPLINFFEERKSLSPSIGFDTGGNWTGEVGVNMFFDGGLSNQISDRDIMYFNLKYFF